MNRFEVGGLYAASRAWTSSGGPACSLAIRREYYQHEAGVSGTADTMLQPRGHHMILPLVIDRAALVLTELQRDFLDDGGALARHGKREMSSAETSAYVEQCARLIDLALRSSAGDLYSQCLPSRLCGLCVLTPVALSPPWRRTKLPRRRHPGRRFLGGPAACSGRLCR